MDQASCSKGPARCLYEKMLSVSQSEGSVQAFRDRATGADPILLAPEDEVSLLDLVIVVARHRRLILWTTIGVIAAGVIVSFLLPVRYTATTTLLPPQESNSVGAGLMSQLGGLASVASMAGGNLGLKNPNNLQVAMLQSQTVEDAMLDRFHLEQLYHKKRRSDARKSLESAVDIDSGAKDGLIRLSVTDRNPQRAAKMANGYVEEFKKFSATLAVTEASRRRLFFEQQLSQAKDNLAKAEEDLKTTEQKTGVIQLDAQARATIQLVADLRAQVAAKESQIAAMRSFATGENPELQIAEQELAGLQAQEAKMGGASEGAVNALIPKQNMPQSQIEYIRKLRDVKYYETIFDLIARQYEIAKVDEARQGAVVQVVDKATVPDRKSSPRRTLIVIGAAIFGLIAGIAWAFAREGWTRLSNNPAEQTRLAMLRQSVSPGRTKHRRVSAV